MLKDSVGYYFILVLMVDLIVSLLNLVKHSLCGEEPAAVVKDKRASSLVFVCSCLEALPDLHLEQVTCQWFRWIKELWSMANLYETSFTHSLLDNDVEDLTHSLSVLPIRVIDI